ncbi:hypothetical protein [Frankia sp. AvcI1]|uniref:hypothetical protein n=1 Tax=Frankia sp. AvcI1 TaxID=573496 RepID=UPI0021199F7D|nr:hypothetical protein [Frankia sp. AvcI1]
MSAVDEGGCGCPRRTRPASSSRPEGIDRAALEQALADEHLTPLPWAADELGPDVVVRSLAGNWVCETGGSHRETPEADARLIAAAVSALPGLLAELAAAEQQRDQARAELEMATRSADDLPDDEVDAAVRQVGLGSDSSAGGPVWRCGVKGGAVPTATPHADILLDEVTRLRAELADSDQDVRRWAGIAIGAQGELDQLRAHQTLPLSRLVVGVAACAVTTAVGVADGLRERWRRRADR